MTEEAKKRDLLADPGADPALDPFAALLEAPFKVDRNYESRIKHGARAESEIYDTSWKRMNLRRDIRREIQEALLAGEASLIRPVDRVVVDLLVRQLAHIREIDVYLAEHGVLDSIGDPRAALKHYGQFMNIAIKLCDQLCITPKTRIQLGLNAAATAPDLAAEIQDAKSGNGKH